MRTLIGILFLMGLLLFIIVGSTWFVFNLFSRLGLKPGSKAWDNLTQKLRARLDILAPKLVPWDTEMLSLLSLNRAEEKKDGIFSGESSGLLTTIYQEPIIAFAKQTTQNGGLILARTSDREFHFRLKGRETEIWLDRQPFAVLMDGTLLSAGKTSRQLARLENAPGESQTPFSIGDRPAAAITNPEKVDGPNPRALTLLRNFSAEEESAALALALLTILK